MFFRQNGLVVAVCGPTTDAILSQVSRNEFLRPLYLLRDGQSVAKVIIKHQTEKRKLSF